MFDFLTNGRRKAVTIQHGEEHANSDPLLVFKNNEGVEVGRVDGEGRATFRALNFNNLPTTASGLLSGDLWNDNGTLKIVA